MVTSARSGRIAFLGPEGTFAAEAADRVAPEAERVPLPTTSDVMAAVRAEESDLGLVPIENSIEGSVTLTVDELVFGPRGLFIRGEHALPVRMNLIGRPGTRVEDLTEVRSHTVALAQSREWLRRELPSAVLTATPSTAEAAHQVATAAAAGGGVAALGTAHAAARFGLEVLVPDVHDRDGNTTRFVLLGRTMPPATGADKTSIVVFFGPDEPGQLMRVLDEFALRAINLNKIESRPTKTQLGQYCILIDAAGHLTEARMAEALRSIHRHVGELRVLGTYPRADLVAEPPPPSDSDRAYEGASSWYADLVRHVGAQGSTHT